MLSPRTIIATSVIATISTATSRNLLTNHPRRKPRTIHLCPIDLLRFGSDVVSRCSMRQNLASHVAKHIDRAWACSEPGIEQRISRDFTRLLHHRLLDLCQHCGLQGLDIGKPHELSSLRRREFDVYRYIHDVGFQISTSLKAYASSGGTRNAFVNDLRKFGSIVVGKMSRINPRFSSDSSSRLTTAMTLNNAEFLEAFS